MKTIRVPFVLAAASALLLLAGCSGGGSASDQGDATAPTSTAPSASASATPVAEQSKAEACEVVSTAFTEVTQASSTMSSSDPQAAMATFQELAATVRTDFEGITNTEIAPLARDASAALGEYVTFIEELAADPSKADGLSDQITALQTTYDAAAQACLR